MNSLASKQSLGSFLTTTRQAYKIFCKILLTFDESFYELGRIYYTICSGKEQLRFLRSRSKRKITDKQIYLHFLQHVDKIQKFKYIHVAINHY